LFLDFGKNGFLYFELTIAAEKVTTGFAQPGELVVPLLQVFGRKLILAPNE